MYFLFRGLVGGGQQGNISIDIFIEMFTICNFIIAGNSIFINVMVVFKIYVILGLQASGSIEKTF